MTVFLLRPSRAISDWRRGEEEEDDPPPLEMPGETLD
jgi:hypothetical protein